MSRYEVCRSIPLDASPEKVFDTVADYGTWTQWLPWLCAEPTAQVRVSDDSASVGSIYAWKGEIVGEGEIEHRQLLPHRRIVDEIRFVKPYPSQSEVTFDIESAGDGTQITWQMRGSLPWFLFWMRSQMERFLGMDYERGLRMLKEFVETGTVLSQTEIRGIETIGPLRIAGVRQQCSFQDVGSSMSAAFAEVEQKFAQHNLATGGEGISVYHRMDLKSQVFEYTSGFSVPESVDPGPAGLATCLLPQTRALAVGHSGRYDNLGNAWSAVYQYARSKKLKQNSINAFEIYRNDPHETSPSDLRTDVYLPVK